MDKIESSSIIRKIALTLLENNLPCAYCRKEKNDRCHREVDKAGNFHHYRGEYDITRFPEWDELYLEEL